MAADKKIPFKEPQYDEQTRRRAYEMVDDPKTQLLFDADATDADALRDEMAKPADQRNFYNELSDDDYRAWQYGWDQGILDEDYTEDLSNETLKANEEYKGQYGYDRAVRSYRKLTPEEKAERNALREKRKKEEERRNNKRRMRDMFGMD